MYLQIDYNVDDFVLLFLGLSFVVVAIMIWCCLRCKDRFLQFAVFIMSCFIATPYLMAYDTIILCWIAVGMLSRYGASGWQQMSYRLIFALIPIGVALSMAHVPGSSLVMLLMLAWTLSETGLFDRKSRLVAAE